MRVKAVLFDLFNTLVLLENDDAFYMPSLTRLHEHLVKNAINIPFKDFVQAYFEVRDRLYVETNKSLEDPHFNIRVSQTLHKFGYRLTSSDPIVVGATEAFTDEFVRYIHLDEDTLYVLKKLHGRFRLGIISNLSIPECVSRILPKFSLDRFFDVVVISGAINRRKPSPEIFERTLKTLGVEAEDAVFVGDSPGIDIKGAKRAGLKAVLIEREPPPRGSMSLAYEIPGADEKVAPDRVIKSLRELLDLVEDS